MAGVASSSASVYTGIATADELLRGLDHYREHGTELRGLETGLDRLDDLTGGIMPGEAWGLGGPTGFGKTQVALAVSGSIADRGKPVRYYCLERPAITYERRLMAQRTGINVRSISRGGAVTKEEYAEAVKWATELRPEFPLRFIGVGPQGIGVPSVDAISRDVQDFEQRAGESPLVVVDHVNLLYGGRGANRGEELKAEVSRLFGWINDDDTPRESLLLAQLNRASYTNGDPGLESFSETAGIEWGITVGITLGAVVIQGQRDPARLYVNVVKNVGSLARLGMHLDIPRQRVQLVEATEMQDQGWGLGGGDGSHSTA